MTYVIMALLPLTVALSIALGSPQMVLGCRRRPGPRPRVRVALLARHWRRFLLYMLLRLRQLGRVARRARPHGEGHVPVHLALPSPAVGSLRGADHRDRGVAAGARPREAGPEQGQHDRPTVRRHLIRPGALRFAPDYQRQCPPRLPCHLPAEHVGHGTPIMLLDSCTVL